MTSLLLAGLLAAPSYTNTKTVSRAQVRRHAHQIVQMLKKQDPRVLRSVMYYMKWVPRLEYKRQQCKKNVITHPDDPVMDMLLDAAGIPLSGPRKRK
jgi:hypothetical protein